MQRTWLARIGLVMVLLGIASASGAGPVPTWDRQLKGAARFKVLSAFDGAAVLDKETGLVWERSPDPNPIDWLNAKRLCHEVSTGGRYGWRPPTVQELGTLLDPRATASPYLPAGHPFANVKVGFFDFYWTATTYDAFTALDHAFSISFATLSIAPSQKSSFTLFRWCVRGGQVADPGM